MSPMLLGGGGTVDDSLSFLLNTGAARAMFDGADPSAAGHATAAARQVLADHYENDAPSRTEDAGEVSS